MHDSSCSCRRNESHGNFAVVQYSILPLRGPICFLHCAKLLTSCFLTLVAAIQMLYSTQQWVSNIKMEQLLDHMHLHMLGGFDPINRGLHFLHPTSHKLCTVLFQKQQMLFHISDILMGVLDFVDEMFGCCQLYFYSFICGETCGLA